MARVSGSSARCKLLTMSKWFWPGMVSSSQWEPRARVPDLPGISEVDYLTNSSVMEGIGAGDGHRASSRA